ncbi:YkvA family protein [soil metagenome]
MRTALLVAAGLMALWGLLMGALYLVRPEEATLRQAVRLLPDTLRLLGRLARDQAVPRSARWPVWILLGYLALPLDLVPDFIPVIGWADYVILVALWLRRLVRRAGPDVVARHWSGPPEGLVALRSLFRLGEGDG